ncbi:MAG: hypothetical protein ACFCGT_23060 [Sandaracinaceae bacterium]
MSDPTSDLPDDVLTVEDLGSGEAPGASAPPTDAGALVEARAQEALGPPPVEGAPPEPPRPAASLRPVSGRYRGSRGRFEVELRVDVDRSRPTQRVSGDFILVNGRTKTYVGSFIVDSPSTRTLRTALVIRGEGSYSFHARYPIVQVVIPRRTPSQTPAAASLQFFSRSDQGGASYACELQSRCFRTLRLETDWVDDITGPVFQSYATGALPSGGPARDLSVVGAYAEAGIEMVPTIAERPIQAGGAGPTWSDAELHGAMEDHFSLWEDLEAWAVWLLAAEVHDLGAGLYGIMFDQRGRQRQGCAVFHRGIGGTNAERLRLQLYTYVHELGHCFNLLHSWQKAFADPPGTNRPRSLSWMNYPWNYPDGGPAAFWSRFPFRFDVDELVHLRHAFRSHIVMGGSPFATGAGLDAHVMADPVEDRSGLRLRLSTHKPQDSFAFGEPVVIGLRLSASAPRRVQGSLHPSAGLVHLAVLRPSGEVVAFDPVIDHLMGDHPVTVDAERPLTESAYIGYGRDGFVFDAPGAYALRAAYAAPDGSEVRSNVLRVRVRYPVSQEQESVAELFLGEEQGMLLALRGSDHPSLQRGNEAFDRVLTEHGEHPLAAYARLVQGRNAARAFKRLEAGRVAVREAQLERSAMLLTTAARSGVIDERSVTSSLESLATAQAEAGDPAGAEATRETMRAVPSDGS